MLSFPNSSVMRSLPSLRKTDPGDRAVSIIDPLVKAPESIRAAT